MHVTDVLMAAGSGGSSRDALQWVSDILTAVASFVVVIGGIAGARYLRRANLRLTDCELSAGREQWLILRVSAELENKGFLKLSFRSFKGQQRPSIAVREAVDVPSPDGDRRQIEEVREWVVRNLDSDVIDPGEAAGWTEVFHLDPPTAATVGYRITCKVPVRPSLWAQLVWAVHKAGSWLGIKHKRDRIEWWEDETFIPLQGTTGRLEVR